MPLHGRSARSSDRGGLSHHEFPASRDVKPAARDRHPPAGHVEADGTRVAGRGGGRLPDGGGCPVRMMFLEELHVPFPPSGRRGVSQERIDDVHLVALLHFVQQVERRQVGADRIRRVLQAETGDDRAGDAGSEVHDIKVGIEGIHLIVRHSQLLLGGQEVGTGPVDDSHPFLEVGMAGDGGGYRPERSGKSFGHIGEAASLTAPCGIEVAGEDELQGGCAPGRRLRHAALELQGQVVDVAGVQHIGEGGDGGQFGESRRRLRPVVHGEVVLVPGGPHLAQHRRAAEIEVASVDAAGADASRPPAVSAGQSAVRSVEVEEDVAVVLVDELRPALAVDTLHTDPSALCAGRYGEGDAVLGNRPDVGHGQRAVIELHLQRLVGILDEVVARQRHLVSGGGILAAHGRHHGRRHDDMEVVGGGVAGLVDHVDLVGHGSGNVLRDVHQQGVVRDVTGVEECLLVVEEQLADAAQVVSDEADGGLEVALRDDGVGALGQSDVLHLGASAR